MFFILSKLLLFLTKPFIWILVLLALGVLFRAKSWAGKSIKWSLLLFLFFSNTFIFSEFSRLWEVPGKQISTLPTYDCALVLTGMASYNNDLNRLELAANGDRIWQAIDLYHRKKVKKIMISGDSGSITDNGLHEAKQLLEVLKRSGIPADDLILEGSSQNTFENALESAKIIKKQFPDWKKILLITNSTHMRRSLACMEKQELVCTPFSVGMLTGPKRSWRLEPMLLPNVGTLQKWETLTKEWVGYLTYKMVGYL